MSQSYHAVAENMTVVKKMSKRFYWQDTDSRLTSPSAPNRVSAISGLCVYDPQSRSLQIHCNATDYLPALIPRQEAILLLHRINLTRRLL